MIRIAIPLKYNTSFQKEVFNFLSKLGYTWSGGDSLDSPFLFNMKAMEVLLIYVTRPIIKFSCTRNHLNKTYSLAGYNYAISFPTIKKIETALNFLNKYLNENPLTPDLEEMIKCHNSVEKSLSSINDNY